MWFAVNGWDITEWTVALAAFLVATGVVWGKVVMPVRAAWRWIKEWMHRVETSVTWTDDQMRPNSGTSLVDKVDNLVVEVGQMKSDVSLLLRDCRDTNRDRPGARYGNEPTED